MLLEISVAVIAAFIVVFILVLIPVLLKIKAAAGEAEKLLDTVRQQVVPLSHDLTHILNDVWGITQSAERQVGKVEDSVEAIKRMIDRIIAVESTIQRRIEKPLLEIIAVASALIKGVTTFVHYMKKERDTHLF